MLDCNWAGWVEELVKVLKDVIETGVVTEETKKICRQAEEALADHPHEPS